MQSTFYVIITMVAWSTRVWRTLKGRCIFLNRYFFIVYIVISCWVFLYERELYILNCFKYFIIEGRLYYYHYYSLQLFVFLLKDLYIKNVNAIVAHKKFCLIYIMKPQYFMRSSSSRENLKPDTVSFCLPSGNNHSSNGCQSHHVRSI